MMAMLVFSACSGCEALLDYKLNNDPLLTSINNKLFTATIIGDEYYLNEIAYEFIVDEAIDKYKKKESNDLDKVNEMLKNIDEKKVHFDEFAEYNVNLGSVELFGRYYIYIEKNGDLTITEKETRNPEYFTLNNSNLIVNGKVVDEIKIIYILSQVFPNEDIDFIIDKYEKLNRIYKDIEILKTYDGNSVNTKIKTSKKFYDMYLVEYITKDKVLSAKNELTGKFGIIKDDPMIGWHFDELEDDDTIYYETDGIELDDDSTITIIIDEEIIFENDTELEESFTTDNMINVRISSTNCLDDEIELVHLEDKFGGLVEMSNMSNYDYKVCITSNNFSLNTDCILNHVKIFSLENLTNSKLSFFPSTYNVCIGSNDKLWFDVEIGGLKDDYTCLISFKDISTIGRCNEFENNIQIKIINDSTPPTTNDNLLDVYDVNTVFVELYASDNYSGVNATYYCMGNECNSNVLYDGVFEVKCPQSYNSCTTSIKYYSVDRAGNVENIKQKSFYISDKQVKCQADCTTLSSGRFYSICNGIGTCSFLNIEVANKCNGGLPGYYVEYNETHDVMCPNGPYKLSANSKESVSVSGLDCKHYVKKDIPVLHEGEMVIMSIYSCFTE